MKKNGKYRFSLQFEMGSEEAIRAGEFLESLGNKKSRIVIAALNEYIANHPDPKNSHFGLKVNLLPIPMELLDTKIKQLVEERIGSIASHTEFESQSPEEMDSVSGEIFEMLNDLDLFQ